MQGLGSIPENIYLKTCSTSFLEQKVFHSPPWTPSGCTEGQQLQQHRIQLLQRQMANELVIENSLIKELKLPFVSEPSWACFCLLEQYQAGGTLLGPDLKWTERVVYLPSFFLFHAHSLGSFPDSSSLCCLIMISIVLRIGGKGGEGMRTGQTWVQFGDFLFLEIFWVPA